jgi:hypothetical protein
MTKPVLNELLVAAVTDESDGSECSEYACTALLINPFAPCSLNKGTKSTKKVRIAAAVCSGPRRYAREAKSARLTYERGPPYESHYTAKCELDTRADTTGQLCQVSGFHSSMAAVKDVPVATSATLYTFEDGEKVILVFHDALYFGGTMDHSLINPNQIRFNDIDVMDNPFGNPDNIGIRHEDCFIPFVTEGTTVYFDTGCPTDSDLKNYEHFVFTSSDPWDPREVYLGRGSKPDAQTSAMLPHGDKRSMKQMAAAPTELPPYQHESDLILGSISAGLVADRA